MKTKPLFLLIAIFLLGMGVNLFSQNKLRHSIASNKTDSLIDASQGGASPLLFTIPLTDPVISLHDFSNAKEFYVRGGLPNFMYKAKNKLPLLIAYIGGSITQGDNRFRNQSARYIQSMFPDIKMQGLNAGVSGTGTDLGACRLYDQVLKYNPDLVFVEFAVNGGPDEAMEGIVRQIWKYNPKIDICMIYTIYGTQTSTYVAGSVPPKIATFEKISAAYNIPSIHLGLQPSMMENAGTLIWNAPASTVTTSIIFSNDGVHPTPAGGNLYAEAIARAMEQMKTNSADAAHNIPLAVYPDNWEDAKMIAPNDICNYSSGWTQIEPLQVQKMQWFKPWFPYIMSASLAGEYLTFTFTGKSFGFFDVGAPEVGQVEITVDGQNLTLSSIPYTNDFNATLVSGTQVATLNLFNLNCSNYRGQFNIINLAQGVHTVKLSVSSIIPDKPTILGSSNLTDYNANPSKYNQHVLYFGKILIRGSYDSLKNGISPKTDSNVKVVGGKGLISIFGSQSTDSIEVYTTSSSLIKKASMSNSKEVSVARGAYIVRYISTLSGSKSYKVIVR